MNLYVPGVVGFPYKDEPSNITPGGNEPLVTYADATDDVKPFGIGSYKPFDVSLAVCVAKVTVSLLTRFLRSVG